ncbi:hypothetical protein [Amygdalobacter nucleatus]|uniref:LysM domain-containing protein n=1 Tax=Amygdalobacter nucleatus TaxID=3029274 RepID=A0A133YGL8_9FIRM|nr:hypothetical protein [Amygdalobacter nucleatus]KXB42336.1 hypothetical protein HMPREF1872_00319 [Amygdalobacter nucleatus]MDF0485558.1 hypothetical protein [Amygdalobacter nucleatus]WEG36588.1 hypothetical protein PYS63_05425 [Amygdalobacter nucleatus]
MTFDQFLNRVHLSGLRKIIASVVAICILLVAYLTAYGYRQSQNKQVYANFMQAYNQGQAADYVTAETAKFLYAKPTDEVENLVLTALIQAVQSTGKFAPSDKETDDASTVTYSVYKADEIIPLLYKELKSEASPIKNAIKDLAKEPANETAYTNLRSLFAEWLLRANLDKQNLTMSLTSEQIASSLPGLAKSVIALRTSDLGLMSADLLPLLQKEGTTLTDLIKQVASGVESEKPTKTEDNQATKETKPSEPTETAKTTEPTKTQAKTTTIESKPKETTEKPTEAQVKPTKQSAPSKSEFKPHLENNKLPKATEAPKANSKVAAIGKYYQVKKQDNLFDLAEQAYAAKCEDFYDNADKYIELIIQANKLPVRKNVVYLREKQVIYIPAAR